MVGSWIGRALVALPAMLGAVGAGAVVVGWLGEIIPGLAVTGLLSGVTILRASRAGLIVDVDREVILLRTFWRTHRIDVDDLVRVDADGSPETGAPGIRFLTSDGRELGTLALSYLDADLADRVIGMIGAVTGERHVDVSLDRSSFRPSLG